MKDECAMKKSPHPSRAGLPLIICAPSGAGKTTLTGRLRQEFPLHFSVSCTTRSPRPGEVDGQDYYFLDRENFIAQRRRGLFAEWAEVHGNFYGTPLQPLRERLAKGKTCCLISMCRERHSWPLHFRKPVLFSFFPLHLQSWKPDCANAALIRKIPSFCAWPMRKMKSGKAIGSTPGSSMTIWTRHMMNCVHFTFPRRLVRRFDPASYTPF